MKREMTREVMNGLYVTRLYRKTEKKEVKTAFLGKQRVRFWERKIEAGFMAVAASSTIAANRCRSFLHNCKP